MSRLHPIRSTRSVSAALLCALFAFLLAACGGGGGDSRSEASAPDLGQAESANSSSATLGTAGGRITATASNGVRYTLAVPPGALAANTAITLTPLASIGASPLAAGLRGAVRFAPSGLQFAEPATLFIEGADAALPAGRRLVAFSRSEDGSRTSLALPELSRGVLSMPVFHFSDGGASAATEEEVAAVPRPPTPEQQLKERVYDTSARGLRTGPPAVQAEFYRELFVQIVRPALDAGLASANRALEIDGYNAYTIWRRIIVVTTVPAETAAVEALLTNELRVGAEAATRFARSQFEFNLSECTATPPAGPDLALFRLMVLRLELANLGIDTVASALDPATTLRRVRDCARVVIDPAALPTVIRPGTGFSLDLRAGLVFASAAQTVARTGFAFGITASDATLPATANGFSDGEGRFTTVASPTGTQPVFQVQACYAFPRPDVFVEADLATDLCTTQQVGSVVGDGILRGTVTVTARVSTTRSFADASSSGGSSLSESLDASAQVEVDLRTGISRIVSKSAQFSSTQAGNLSTVRNEAVRGCFVSSTQTGRTTISGSSFQVTANDRGSLRLNGTEYTLAVTGISGPARRQGFNVTNFVTSGTCPPEFTDRSLTFDTDLVDSSYMPGNLFIQGSGTIQRAPDGSVNVVGSRNFSEPIGGGSGESGSRSYTLSWNLTGRL